MRSRMESWREKVIKYAKLEEKHRKKMQELLSELDSCREGSENEQGNQEHVNVLTMYISQMEGATPSFITAWQACTFQESSFSCADIIVSAPIYTVNV